MPLVKLHILMTPIVSAVYNTAEVAESAFPSRHSTGRV